MPWLICCEQPGPLHADDCPLRDPSWCKGNLLLSSGVRAHCTLDKHGSDVEHHDELFDVKWTD